MVQYKIIYITIYIAYTSWVTEVKYKSEFESTKDTPYLTLAAELLGVICEEFEENWLSYNSAVLYMHTYMIYLPIFLWVT